MRIFRLCRSGICKEFSNVEAFGIYTSEVPFLQLTPSYFLFIQLDLRFNSRRANKMTDMTILSAIKIPSLDVIVVGYLVVFQG